MAPRPASLDRPALAVPLAGALVAAADMAVALAWFAAHGVAPTRVVQGIAAGWIGRDAALAGGPATVLLGALSHLGIAIAMVAVYWAVSRRWALLAARPIAGGLGYGVVTWATMKFVVLPLSAVTPGGGAAPTWQLIHFASHLFIVGLPSAFLARGLARRLASRAAPPQPATAP
jgi:hypothetical protein